MMAELSTRSGETSEPRAVLPLDRKWQPARLVLDDLRLGSYCRIALSLATSDSTKEAADWSIKPRSAGYRIKKESESLLLVVPTDTSGFHVAHLHTYTPEKVEVVLSVSISGKDVEDWPTLPTEDETRTILAGWAHEHALVPDWLFDGALGIRDESLIRTSLMTFDEKVEECARTSPDPPDLPVIPIHGRELAVDVATWDTEGEKCIVQGSINETPCGRCDDAHLVSCAACGGEGTTPCPATVQCTSCEGSGKALTIVGLLKFGAQQLQAKSGDGANRTASTLADAFGAPDEYLETCATCRGEGKVTCIRCQGEGQRRCPDCVKGRAPCPWCGGDGQCVEYRELTFARTHKVERQISGNQHVINTDDERHFRPLSSSSTDLLTRVPPGRRDALASWVAGRIAERSGYEIARELWIEVLPVVAVDYVEGETTKTAYLIGKDCSVRAPGAVRPSVGRLLTTLRRFGRGHSGTDGSDNKAKRSLVRMIDSISGGDRASSK